MRVACNDSVAAAVVVHRQHAEPAELCFCGNAVGLVDRLDLPRPVVLDVVVAAGRLPACGKMRVVFNRHRNRRGVCGVCHGRHDRRRRQGARGLLAVKDDCQPHLQPHEIERAPDHAPQTRVADLSWVAGPRPQRRMRQAVELDNVSDIGTEPRRHDKHSGLRGLVVAKPPRRHHRRLLHILGTVRGLDCKLGHAQALRLDRRQVGRVDRVLGVGVSVRQDDFDRVGCVEPLHRLHGVAFVCEQIRVGQRKRLRCRRTIGRYDSQFDLRACRRRDVSIELGHNRQTVEPEYATVHIGKGLFCRLCRALFGSVVERAMCKRHKVYA